MYFCNHCRLTKVGKDGEYCDVCKKKATLPTIVPPDTLTASILSTPSFSRSTLENGRLGTYSNNYVNGIVKNISHDVFKGGIGEHILLETTFYTPAEIERNSMNKILDEELSNYDCRALRENAYIASVNPNDILFTESHIENFGWEKRPESDYLSLVSSYSQIDKLRGYGMSLETIKQGHPKLADSVVLGFEQVPLVSQLEGKYMLDADGRHRVRAAQKAGLSSINVKVVGQYAKKGRGDYMG
ncbi:TPA: hypothetical protein ACGO92_000593 [Streptococcus suis]